MSIVFDRESSLIIIPVIVVSIKRTFSYSSIIYSTASGEVLFCAWTIGIIGISFTPKRQFCVMQRNVSQSVGIMTADNPLYAPVSASSILECIIEHANGGR